MEKSRDAFRTISEVSELLDTPAHVLRFWESRFPQVRPVKRAGGRRYYRPTDVALLAGIKRLLHRDGLTIRGVQKVLREQGIRHVMAMADGPLADDAMDAVVVEAEVVTAEVLQFPDISLSAQEEGLPLWSTAEGLPVAPAPAEAEAESEPVAAPVAPPAEDVPEVEAEVEVDWLPARLRALSPADVADRRDALAAVALRLQDLRARLAAAHGAGGR